MTERRFFNDSERAALYLAADGKCTSCGMELEPGWHADHMDPHSRGGATDVVNGQALCPTCNLKKGNKVTKLRAWQERALDDLRQWRPSPDKGFLVEATPGAGKTRLAIAAVKQLFDAGRASRVVIAVPTARLEGQWADEFAAVGIHINPTWHASVGVLPADEHGCAATYAEIANQPLVFRKLTAGRPTVVILDEIHHCADERAWGAGIQSAFPPAVLKLLLSGTPFRSDNSEIPFVNYIDGIGAPDHRYGYEDALRDRVVRSVFFPRRGGKMEWSYADKTVTRTFDDTLSKVDANRRLRTAISPTGQWLPSVLQDADRQLSELRQADPHAAGIVFCEDSASARAVHGLLAVMGYDAVLAISEEKESDQRIREFRNSSGRWLVSIRKVSEGVDIPRLRVGVYATNYLTPMFFRQVVGRLVRTRTDEEDPTGYLFIPDDERLRAMAQDIKNARDHILNEQANELAGELSHESVDHQPSLFTPISSTSEDRGVIADDGTITPQQLAEAERIKAQKPDTAGLPTAVVAQILIAAGHFDQQGPSQAPPVQEPTKADRKQDLKTANNLASRRIAASLGADYSHVNAGLNRAVGVRKLAQCTEDQLQKRLSLAQQWLSAGFPPAGVS